MCRHCNTNVGSRYAREYKEWVEKADKILKDVKTDRWSGILEGVYPLRFLKEVVMMFCSLNGPRFSEFHPGIREFLLNKNSQRFPPNMEILMYLNTSRLITRTGLVVSIEFTHPSSIYLVSECNFPPFGFALHMGLTKYQNLFPISWFCKYKYDEKTDLYVDIPILERNVPFPADYRTEEEIFFDKIRNILQDNSPKDD